MALETRIPPRPIYRIGRLPDAWQPPDWSQASPDGTFGNRFDDPKSFYRVLYASSKPVACFIETLAWYRPDLPLLKELNAIDGENDFSPIGQVPPEWNERRLLGSAVAFGDAYAEIAGAEWITLLRRELLADCLRLGIKDIDASVLKGSQRPITQLASRTVFEHEYKGICYRSRYGDQFENWALFEPFLLKDTHSSAIAKDHPALLEAAKILGLNM